MKAIIYGGCTDIFPTKEEVKEFCKPGAGPDTCSWLICGKNGFECRCLHRPQTLADRRQKGLLHAKRDGCEKVKNFNPLKYGLGTFEF